MIRWLIKVAAVIAIGAAVASGRYVLAAVLAVFIVVAGVLGFRMRRG